MLAIQRPSMGSSKPPHLEMPFGYSFDVTSNFPFPSPTAPAPGPSLLDDNESRFLDSFFDGVGSSDQFDYNLFSNAPDGQEAGFGWDELPPSFMGTTTSFGQQPQIGAQDVPSLTFNGMPSQLHPNPPPHIPPTTSADVLEAATLLQNGSAGRCRSVGERSLFNAPDMTLQPTNEHVRPQAISQLSPPQSYSENHQRQSSGDFMRDTFYADMVFGHSQETIRRQRNANAKMDIRWGSDSSFSTPQGFMAPGHHDRVAAVERAQTDQLSIAFEVHPDAEASPDASQATTPVTAVRPLAPQKSKSNDHLDDYEDSRPKKRRKSKFQEDPEDDDSTSTSNLPGLKKRRPASTKKEKDSDETPGHKRRRSAATSAAGKAARENLTEDQKRENHIRSEQKRRTLIREGFEDLGELVPGLRGGGFSKSAVLIMAADWLEDLMQGNERLKDQLNGMGNNQ